MSDERDSEGAPEEEPEPAAADEEDSAEDKEDEESSGDESSEDETEGEEASESDEEDDESSEDETEGEEASSEEASDEDEDEDGDEGEDPGSRESPRSGKELARGRLLSLAYRLRDADTGELLCAMDEGSPLKLRFGEEALLSGLDVALEGKRAGEELRLSLTPGEAFGESEGGRTRDFRQGDFPAELTLAVGTVFEADGRGGERLAYWVHKVDGEVIRATTRHPWAGRSIDLYAKVIMVEE